MVVVKNITIKFVHVPRSEESIKNQQERSDGHARRGFRRHTEQQFSPTMRNRYVDKACEAKLSSMRVFDDPVDGRDFVNTGNEFRV